MVCPAQRLKTVPAATPSCWFIIARMWLFVFNYVSADSWEGFAKKNLYKSLFFNGTIKDWKQSGYIAATLYLDQ